MKLRTLAVLLALLVPLATGLIGWCPAYLPFRIRTCAAKR